MAQRIPKVGIGLFVSRLHWTVSSACLRKHFSKFGNVLFAEIQIDTKTGLHRGFGWVRMSSESEVQSILGYKRHIIDGYELNVNRDKKDVPELDHQLGDAATMDTLQTVQDIDTTDSKPPPDLKL